MERKVVKSEPKYQEPTTKADNTQATFKQYTTEDWLIVKKASAYGLYLIGGTAIDLLCNHQSVKFWRDRSDNDLDFWTPFDNGNTVRFIKYIAGNFGIAIKDSSDYMVSLELGNIKIETDILIDRDEANKKFTSSVYGIKVMSPIYLFASKFDRYINSSNTLRKETDFKDLQILLSIIEKTNGFDELEHHLSNLNYDQTAEDKLNEIIQNML